MFSGFIHILQSVISSVGLKSETSEEKVGFQEALINTLKQKEFKGSLKPVHPTINLISNAEDDTKSSKSSKSSRASIHSQTLDGLDDTATSSTTVIIFLF